MTGERDLIVDEIVVRHGPASAIASLFPGNDDITKACHPSTVSDLTDPTRSDNYKDFYTTRVPILEPINQRVVLANHVLTSARLAAKGSFDPIVHMGFGMRIEDEKPKYVIYLAPGTTAAALPSRSFYEIPIVYESTHNAAEMQDKIRRRVDEYRRALVSSYHRATRSGAGLAWGVGIRNASMQERQAGAEQSDLTGGTLGCIVRFKSSGTAALLTTASALGKPWYIQGGRDGDEIILSPDTLGLGEQAVARVTRIVAPQPSSPRSSIAFDSVRLNRFEAVLAELLIDNYWPGYPSDIGDAPIPRRDSELPADGDFQSDLLDSRVFKLGAGSGPTWGTVEGVDVTIQVGGWGEQFWYQQLIAIVGESDKPFATSGDGGAAVVREDGLVLGLIIGGNESVTFACPIGPILDEFECEIVYDEPEMVL